MVDARVGHLLPLNQVAYYFATDDFRAKGIVYASNHVEIKTICSQSRTLTRRGDPLTVTHSADLHLQVIPSMLLFVRILGVLLPIELFIESLSIVRLCWNIHYFGLRSMIQPNRYSTNFVWRRIKDRGENGGAWAWRHPHVSLVILRLAEWHPEVTWVPG